MNELALFAGVGGGILGGLSVGFKTVCAVERDAYAASILAQRQNDRLLDPFPIWSDVETFDGKPWRGIVEVVSGGFPCQNISVAGDGTGIHGSKSKAWVHMARIIGEVRPRFVWVENSPNLVRKGLARILSDLAEMGYDAVWGVVGAGHTSAPHIRKRIWILAYTRDDSVFVNKLTAKKTNPNLRRNGQNRKMDSHANSLRPSQFPGDEQKFWDGIVNMGEEKLPYSSSDSILQTQREFPEFSESRITSQTRQTRRAWPAEPSVGRVAHGVAHRMDRIRAIGNGQVPRVVALAWHILNGLKS